MSTVKDILVKVLNETDDSTSIVVKNSALTVQKLKETITQLDNLTVSINQIKRGTPGSRKKWTKDVAATFCNLIQLLPLVDLYEDTEEFVNLVSSRLKVNVKVNKSITFGKFGKHYAALLEVNGNKCLQLLDEAGTTYNKTDFIEAFKPCKINVRHVQINRKFETLKENFLKK